MSKNWGKTPITNADKRFASQTEYFAPAKDELGRDIGHEKRIDRRPLGKVERFVDPQGNLMSLQLYGDGDSRRHETEIRTRAQFHKKGFVEYSKCPLKHGTRYSSEVSRKDFARMPAELEGECKSDPRVMERKDGDLYALTGCKHIEWLIEHRRIAAADACAKRNAHVAAQEKAKKEEAELKSLQADLLKEQLAERRQRKPKAKDAVE